MNQPISPQSGMMEHLGRFHSIKCTSETVSSGNSEIDEQKVLQRLSGRSTGLTTRDLARLLSVRPSEANQALLSLQAKGQVSLRGTKWFAVNSRAEYGSNVRSQQGRSPAYPDASVQVRPIQQVMSEPAQAPSNPTSRVIDRRSSRWSVFRRLCDYYAECVRLDQRSSITATASDEFESFVCLDGAIPNSNQIQIRTRETWHKWVRKLAEDDYLFVGYPIQRYRWRDTQKGEDVDFVSPVFVQPFRVKIEGTQLNLEAIGSIRINEGWLERRLKNVDERRAFLNCAVLIRSVTTGLTKPLGLNVLDSLIISILIGALSDSIQVARARCPHSRKSVRTVSTIVQALSFLESGSTQVVCTRN